MQRIAAALLITAFSVGLLEPCTIFTATENGRTLVGGNEDWEDLPVRVWFISPGEGAHGMVLFGFINGWAQAGMNDQGLFFDWVAGFETGWTRSPDLPDYFENISEKILEDASTVEEAIAMSRAYNVDGFRAARMMLVDRQGNSAIVGFQDGEFRVWRTGEDVQIVGVRAETAGRLLKADTGVSVDRFGEILSACRLQGRLATRYSNVYDLKDGVVYVVAGTWDEGAVALSLEAELEKGSHYYDLSLASEQLEQPPKVDHKTQPVVDISQAAVRSVTGTYRGSTTTLQAVRIGVESDRMYLWPVAGQPRKYRLDPISENVFSLRCMVGTLTAVRDADGVVTGMIMDQAGRRNELSRIE